MKDITKHLLDAASAVDLATQYFPRYDQYEKNELLETRMVLINLAVQLVSRGLVDELTEELCNGV